MNAPESLRNRLASLEQALRWAGSCVAQARHLVEVHGGNTYAEECLAMAFREIEEVFRQRKDAMSEMRAARKKESRR